MFYLGVYGVLIGVNSVLFPTSSAFGFTATVWYFVFFYCIIGISSIPFGSFPVFRSSGPTAFNLGEGKMECITGLSDAHKIQNLWSTLIAHTRATNHLHEPQFNWGLPNFLRRGGSTWFWEIPEGAITIIYRWSRKIRLRQNIFSIDLLILQFSSPVGTHDSGWEVMLQYASKNLPSFGTNRLLSWRLFQCHQILHNFCW